MEPQFAARGARAADHVEILSRDSGTADRAGVCRAARAGSSSARWPASPSSFATPSSDAKNRPHHRRRNFRPLGRRAAGERRISRCMSTRPRNRPAAVAAPISTPRPTSPSTTAIICCCRATVTRWLMRARSAPRPGWSGRSARQFPFVDLTTGQRWQLDLGDGRLPLWVFDEARRVPDTGLRDYLALMPLIWASARTGWSATPFPARARCTSGWCSRCCWRRSTSIRRRARRASPARSCAKRCWRAARPAGR